MPVDACRRAQGGKQEKFSSVLPGLLVGMASRGPRRFLGISCWRAPLLRWVIEVRGTPRGRVRNEQRG